MRPQVMHGPAGDRPVGIEYKPHELAALLNRQAVILKSSQGGVTFSGGEPLMQARFIAEVIELLEGMHVLLDTSGYGSEQDFRLLLERIDLVYFDLKLADPAAHRYYTGCENFSILQNLAALSTSGVPYVIRVPLVPGVTDTKDNLGVIAKTASGLPGLLRVDLLPYNRVAGAKYASLGMEFKPEYDEDKPVNVDRGIFQQAGVEVRLV